MRVLHLVTSPLGGAGIASRRINQALLNIGIDSKLMYGGRNYKSAKNEILLERKRSEKFLSSSNTIIQRYLIQKGKNPITTISLNIIDDWNNIVNKFDVIHVHSLYNLTNISSLKPLLDSEKKIVFTLHDQRLFTGGCHYSFGCNNYMDICSECPQVRFYAKDLVKREHLRASQIFRNLSNIQIVSPSIWLMNLAKQSEMLKNLEIHHVNNPIPEPSIASQSCDNPTIWRHAIPRHRIGFVAADLSNPNKGLKTLLSAMETIDFDKRENYQLELIGRGKIPDIPKGFQVNVIQDANEETVQRSLKKIDLIVVASGLDNSPNIIGESLMAGTSVVGSKTGGISELLNFFNMPTFEVGNSNELSRIIRTFNWNYERSKITEKARIKFNYDTIAKKYLNIYMN